MSKLEKCPQCGFTPLAWREHDGEMMHYCTNCDTWIDHSTMGNKDKHVCLNCREPIE